METDTIAAIATGMTNSGIGIIRISGPEAFTVIDRIYKGKEENQLSSAKSHTVHYGWIEENGTRIDEVLILILRGPHTYTRQDTVEIDCHGGVLVMQKILEAVLKNGARLAKPGEFTKRAFLSGRIDLSQAEAVMDLIQAENEFALKASLRQLKGEISKKIKELRNEILYEIAFIESALDDPEHISLEGYSKKLLCAIEKWILQIEELISASENGRIIKEGIRTVILGKPNVGKSSLMNRLAGEECAIVTEVAGTTRDILSEHILLGNIVLNLLDTAGIRETSDTVEQIGVKKARLHAQDADLILYMADASLPLDENDEEILEFIKDKQAIVLLNKIDLELVADKKELEQKSKRKVIPISAKQGTGISELQKEIEAMFLKGKISENDQLIISNARHKEALMQALESFNLAKESIEKGMTEDFYTIDLTDAYEKLGLIIGEAVEDDLINKIFAEFCMGK